MERSGSDERGQATVEFALVLPLIIALALGIAQVGLIVRTQLMAIHAAREAARALSIDPQSDVADIVERSADLDAAHTQTTVDGVVLPGEPVTVTVTADVPVGVPIVAWIIDDVTVDASVTVVVEGAPPGTS